MQALAARRDEIDHILVETSGLALPKPLVQAFNWPEIKSACTVDAVITVVDGPAVAAGRFAADPKAVTAQRESDPNLDHASSLHELFEDQLSAADLVILNKTDLLTDPQRRAVTDLIRREIPEAVKVVEARHGRLDLEIMVGLDSAAEDFIHHRPDHHSKHHDGEGHHGHGHDAFDSVIIDLPEVHEAPLLAALEALVSEQVIYRAKGFVAIPGKPMRLVIQGVGSRFDRYFDRRWRPDEARLTRIVLIGRELDTAALRARLARRIATAA
jgi:cobalamin biosynthesis protein CobW